MAVPFTGGMQPLSWTAPLASGHSKIARLYNSSSGISFVAILHCMLFCLPSWWAVQEASDVCVLHNALHEGLPHAGPSNPFKPNPFKPNVTPTTVEAPVFLLQVFRPEPQSRADARLPGSFRTIRAPPFAAHLQAERRTESQGGLHLHLPCQSPHPAVGRANQSPRHAIHWCLVRCIGTGTPANHVS